MAYIGQPAPTTVSATATTETFLGDGSNTDFTLSKTVVDNNPSSIEVFVSNVQQQPTTSYTLSGTTLSFTEAPDSGEPIYVTFRDYTSAPIFTVPDGGVTEVKIATGAVTVNKIGALAVTNAKLATDAVTSAKIQNGAVTGDKLDISAVTTTKILDAAVTTAKIAAANVTTALIADAAITTSKIAAANITTALIADSNITTSKIAAGNITTALIADSNVTTAKLASSLALDTISVNSYSSNHFALGDITGNVTLNVAFASYFSGNATGNINWTFEAPTDNTKVRAIILELASGGLYTQTWPTTTRWPAGTAPTLVATAGNVDVLVFITDDSGTNWRGALSQSDSF